MQLKYIYIYIYIYIYLNFNSCSYKYIQRNQFRLLQSVITDFDDKWRFWKSIRHVGRGFHRILESCFKL